jgi:glycosyltransferase involved in cell wall biosynthesis
MGLSGVQRTLKFVKYLKNYNWEPTVITTGEVGYFAHDDSLTEELKNLDIELIRIGGKEPNAMLAKFGTVKLPTEFIRKILNRISQTIYIPDNKVSWSKKIFKKVEEIISKNHFDAIFITCPPFSAFSYVSRIRKNSDIPIFVDYRDLWYESYFSFYPTPVHKHLNKKEEYNALKAVDRVLVTNRRIKEKLLKDFPFLSFDDVVIISHGFDPEDFERITPVPKPKNKLVIMYSGIFMAYNTPKYFLKAFKEITVERPDIAAEIELHFVGYLGKENKKLVRKLNIQEFVKDFGYVNHDDSIAKIKSADVLWFMVDRLKNIDAILPGKIYEYVGAQKPIIACVPDGAAKMAVEEYGAGFICEPDKINDIKQTIFKVYELYKKNDLPKPDESILHKYRRDYLTEILSKQFQQKLRPI